jgi:type I restriction enzyme S subunit
MDTATADLFPDEFEESSLGLIPKGWKVSTIGESVKIVGGSTPSTKNPDYWEGGTIHWTTPKDLSSLSTPVLLNTERKITELGLKQISSGLLPKGTLLLSSRAPIGYLAISEIPVAINQGYIGMICDKGLPNYYILNWTRENIATIIGRANGTTFLEISKSNFRPIELVIPDIKILDVFIKQVERLYQMIVNNLQESHTLATLRDTLLPKLMSGEIRVKEAEKIINDKL